MALSTRRSFAAGAAGCAAFLLAACAGSSLPVSAQEPPSTWAFEPARDEFRADAVLDLRALNEKVAGESGFLRVDANGDFVLENGKPIRLWAVNTDVGRRAKFQPRPLWAEKEQDLDRHARFLAKRGVNMVRLHAHLNPDLKANPQAKITDVNQAERDWIWRTVAAMKKQGIYTTVSPYWANTMEISPEWGVPGGKQDAHGLLFFDEKLQEGYRAWMKALLAEKNPYTGIPLAQDPALGIIQIQNEDSLLFWTVNNIKGEQRARLGRKFAEWVKRKYSTLEAAARAWQGDRLPGDDLAGGVLDFHNIWEMTQERKGGRSQRLADQLAFWTETMHAFNKAMGDYFRRELGCRQIVNAGNWKTADSARLNDAERWSYTANEVLAVNHYFTGIHQGPNNGWAIVKGDRYTSPSALTNPLELPVLLRQVKGRPMMVTESNWVFPTRCAAEGPFLVSAYQSLLGLDGFYWFSMGTEQWTPPQSANGYMPSQQKWFMGSPDVLGGFPAAALAFRKGYIRKAPPAVREARESVDLWARRPGLLSEGMGFDPNRDSERSGTGAEGTVSPFAFLAGPVEVEHVDRAKPPVVADLSKCIDLERKTVRSLTGEVALDWGKGVCTVNTPCYQGAAAWFRNSPEIAVSDVKITSRNEYGAVSVISLDGKPLKTSGKVLVQVGTRSMPTGWADRPVSFTADKKQVSGLEIESYGKAPWQVERARVTVTLANRGLKSGRVLDANGNAAGPADLKATGTGVTLNFPETALYVVLE